jgi:hypothetical protein
LRIDGLLPLPEFDSEGGVLLEEIEIDVTGMLYPDSDEGNPRSPVWDSAGFRRWPG